MSKKQLKIYYMLSCERIEPLLVVKVSEKKTIFFLKFSVETNPQKSQEPLQFSVV